MPAALVSLALLGGISATYATLIGINPFDQWGVELGKAMAKSGRRPTCFIQVNIGSEEQKGGCAISDLPDLLARAHAAGLPVAGLMCIPPVDVEPAPYFALLAKLGREAGVSGLSMGMSSDYETAVTLGATHVRVGSAIFGTR